MDFWPTTWSAVLATLIAAATTGLIQWVASSNQVKASKDVSSEPGLIGISNSGSGKQTMKNPKIKIINTKNNIQWSASQPSRQIEPRAKSSSGGQDNEKIDLTNEILVVVGVVIAGLAVAATYLVWFHVILLLGIVLLGALGGWIASVVIRARVGGVELRSWPTIVLVQFGVLAVGYAITRPSWVPSGSFEESSIRSYCLPGDMMCRISQLKA